MKLLKKDFKHNEVKLEIENSDDLWYLNSLISVGDTLKGRTLRKIGGSGEAERAKQASRKPVFLSIDVEKIEFSTTSTTLRVSGKITAGPEDVPLGNYHSFSLENRSIFSLIKKQWLSFHKEKLQQAIESKYSSILICVCDRDQATFAALKKYGYDILSELNGTVQKKGDDTPVKSDFFGEIIKKIVEYDKQRDLNHLVIASPAFWKETLVKQLPDDLRKKTITATCSSTGSPGVTEVLKRPELQQALRDERTTLELKLGEELFERIAKGDPACYGLKETASAAEAGAVETLLVTEHCIQTMREQETFERLEKIMETVDGAKGTIHIVSSEHEGGKKLDGLGGIGGLLRFALN